MIKESFVSINSKLQASLTPPQNKWLQSALDRLESCEELTEELLTLSAMTRRKLGNKKLSPNTESLDLENDHLPIAQWSYADTGRVLLLLKAILEGSIQTQALILGFYQQGDEAEISAITGGLILYESEQVSKTCALEVGRTNSKQLFSSLLHNNPFPARYFSEQEFNQMVLKGLFMEIGINAVYGLSARANAELSRMCEDYIKERTAAGRSIPVDIWLALQPFANDYGESQLTIHLKSEDPWHRFYVVKALRQSPVSSEKQHLLDEHIKTEQDERIIALYNAKK